MSVAVPSATPWPALTYPEIAPTVDFLHRLSQIAGKYTLNEPFEPNWGNIVLSVTPRGFATPLLHAPGQAFAIEFDLFDHQVLITSTTGRKVLPLTDDSVANFYARFVEATSALGLPPPANTREVEIPDAPAFEDDHADRAYDRDVAPRLSVAWTLAAQALTHWQAPYRGHRPRTGIMWGGFDLSATRYNGNPLVPPPKHPVFLQNGETDEVVALGFAFGDARSPHPAFYAYLSPAPAKPAEAVLQVPGALWQAEAGVFALPWEPLRGLERPLDAVVQFGDEVYALALASGRWTQDLVGSRHDGWYASRHLVAPAGGPPISKAGVS